MEQSCSRGWYLNQERVATVVPQASSPSLGRDHRLAIQRSARWLVDSALRDALEDVVSQTGSIVLQAGKDFTVVLPHLVASAVFRFLSTREMLTCTQVCWRWRNRIVDEENLAWEALARCKGWTELTTGLRGSWLDEYRRQTQLNQNWCHGRCSVKAPKTRGTHRKPICGVVIDQARNTAITAGDSTVRAWDCATGSSTTVHEFGSQISCIAAPPRCDALLIGAEAGNIALLSWPGTVTLWTAGGHTDAVEVACFCGDGDWLVTGGIDRIIRVWVRATGELQSVLKAHSSEVRMLKPIPGSTSEFLSSCYDSDMKLWSIDHASSEPHLKFGLNGHSEEVSCCAASSTRLVSGSFDRTLVIWALDDGGANLATLVGHEGEIYCCDFNHNTIVSGDSKATIRLWALGDGAPLFVMPQLPHVGVVRCLTVDRTKIVSGGDRRRVVVWDLDSLGAYTIIHKHPRLVNSLQVLGSSHLVTTTPDAPGILTVVHFDNGFEARRLTSPKPLKAILPPRDVSAILPRVA